MGNGVQKYVSDLFNDGIGFLALVESVAETSVNSDDIVDVPEYLFEKVGASMLRDDIGFLKGLDP